MVFRNCAQNMCLGDKSCVKPMTVQQQKECDAYHFFSHVGSLNYAYVFKPEIGHALLQCSKRVLTPDLDVKNAIEHIYRYLQYSKRRGVKFTQGQGHAPIGSADATGPKTQYNGGCFFGTSVHMAGGPVFFKCGVTTDTMGSVEAEGLAMKMVVDPKDLHNVSHDDTPFEYLEPGHSLVQVPGGSLRAGQACINGILEFRNLLDEFQSLPNQTTLFYDYAPSLVLTDCEPWFKIVCGKGTSSGKKHFRLKILQVIHRYRRKTFYPGQVGTKDMWCDIQTKGVTDINNVHRLIGYLTGHGDPITSIPSLTFRHYGAGLRTMHSGT